MVPLCKYDIFERRVVREFIENLTQTTGVHREEGEQKRVLRLAQVNRIQHRQILFTAIRSNNDTFVFILQFKCKLCLWINGFARWTLSCLYRGFPNNNDNRSHITTTYFFFLTVNFYAHVFRLQYKINTNPSSIGILSIYFYCNYFVP